MSVKMEAHEDGMRQIIACDACSERIVRHGDGMAVFEMAIVPGHSTAVLHAHKRGCLHEAKRRVGDMPGTVELGEHLAFLALNCGVDAAVLRERVADWEARL